MIKFRAWIKEEKCFADYIETIRYYAKEVDLCWGGICESDCFDFEGVIFTQSTGLKDLNGVEIFEGDILTDGHTLGVLRNHQTLGFYMVDEKGEESFLSDTVDTEGFEEAKEFMKNSIEIIGNIYENPELLEVKE
jgi:hypothetical protein